MQVIRSLSKKGYWLRIRAGKMLGVGADKLMSLLGGLCLLSLTQDGRGCFEVEVVGSWQ